MESYGWLVFVALWAFGKAGEQIGSKLYAEISETSISSFAKSFTVGTLIKLFFLNESDLNTNFQIYSDIFDFQEQSYFGLQPWGLEPKHHLHLPVIMDSLCLTFFSCYWHTDTASCRHSWVKHCRTRSVFIWTGDLIHV